MCACEASPPPTNRHGTARAARGRGRATPQQRNEWAAACLQACAVCAAQRTALDAAVMPPPRMPVPHGDPGHTHTRRAAACALACLAMTLPSAVWCLLTLPTREAAFWPRTQCQYSEMDRVKPSCGSSCWSARCCDKYACATRWKSLVGANGAGVWSSSTTSTIRRQVRAAPATPWPTELKIASAVLLCRTRVVSPGDEGCQTCPVMIWWHCTGLPRLCVLGDCSSSSSSKV